VAQFFLSGSQGLWTMNSGAWNCKWMRCYLRKMDVGGQIKGPGRPAWGPYYPICLVFFRVIFLAPYHTWFPERNQMHLIYAHGSNYTHTIDK
jgi:hypothetical protein